MTTNLGGKGVTDALGLESTDAPCQDSMQQADGAERAELQRALLVYGMAGALGAGQARGAIGDVRN
ncbi:MULTISPECIES: hypothetical protein [Massilia]|uniref:Uncharacterized protein n=2 Tax=Massilia TaxID=149698 RepID=A0A7X3FY87_9BURK|nr:hypothetical protein [Telluria cellulosilytica]MDN4046054.1 hypothetical protein [Massilia sp. YIM B02787]MVW60118.1 hypothetical protein [Telluria cellulosilytica]